MRILAKTKGPVLLCENGDFLDAERYRIVEYDRHVRDWNNKEMLDIKCYVSPEATDDELKKIGVDEFAKKYDINKKAEPEPKVEAQLEVHKPSKKSYKAK